MPFLLPVMSAKACSHLCRAILLRFHDGAHGDSEILAASRLCAAIHAFTLGGVGMADQAAMAAHRTGGPEDAFQHLAGFLARFGSRLKFSNICGRRLQRGAVPSEE